MQGIILDCVKDSNKFRILRPSKGGRGFQASLAEFDATKKGKACFWVKQESYFPASLKGKKVQTRVGLQGRHAAIVLYFCTHVCSSRSVHWDESSGPMSSLKLLNVRH